MSSLDDFAKVNSPLQAPKEWDPQVTQILDRNGKVQSGSASLVRLTTTTKEEELLRDAGFDPVDVRIKGDISYRKWMRYDQEWLHYYRFDIERKTAEDDEERSADLEDIKKLFLSVPSVRREYNGDDALVFVASDWQIGKTDKNGGTAETVERIRASFAQTILYAQQLRAGGFPVPDLHILGTGDLHEGCTGFYPAQEFLVDLDRRAQSKVVRRLFVDFIKLAAPHFRRIKLTGVGGNHGEFRKKGNAFTNTGDNDDVSVLESVQEIFEGRDDYSHVSFEIPFNELDIVVDVAGVNIGLAHGHQFKGGASIAAKAETWWKNQDFGLQAQRESQILVTGHFHHFLANTWGTRTHFQAPSQDPGSAHYTNYSGLESPTGQLVFRVDSTLPFGWDHMRVL